MRALHVPPRAALLVLAGSLLGHVALLAADRAPRDAVPQPARAVSVALLPPAALPAALPDPVPPAPPAPPQAPARAAPAAPPPDTPPAVATEAPSTSPPLRLAGPAAWTYRLRQYGQDGEALLEWQPQPDGRYSLRLTKRIGERALPAQHSVGLLDSGGLAPERYATQQGGRDRQAVDFDAEDRRISFSASPARLERPDAAQDRLSWWLQLAALVQAAPTPGGRWRVWVAGPRGELREWVFDALDAQPADAGLLHLRRQLLGPHDPGIDVWLDPTRGFWPARLRQGDPETRGYEITLADVNS
ncbi:hypothetical protein ACG02S_01385 [Roseateles sp. DC23W]|uniref:DUF3108 domain-containing protein n=1 Tax=Pelomonas dachongensis TaxID=3299029 RepID=A0ABW7EGG1_9BURK